MLEEERKYEVAAGFTMPDLTECVPEGGRLIVRPQRKLRAIYFDTTDLRLARAGACLRYRRGDDEPWTVKLPTEAPGVRTEVSMAGPAATPPERLLDLVTVYTRGVPVAPVVTLTTVRQAYQLCDRDDRVAVEVVDDTVSVPDGRRVALKFREIEVERKAGRARLLDRVEVALRDAGALVGDFTPKHVRALGPAALQPPDWPTTPARRSRWSATGTSRPPTRTSGTSRCSAVPRMSPRPSAPGVPTSTPRTCCTSSRTYRSRSSPWCGAPVR